MPNKVYLSFGRHERYGQDTAIEREDMIKAFLSGKQLQDCLPPCASIYHSPLARAVQTAQFEALGMNCTHLLESAYLSEDASKYDISCFIQNILQHTDNTIQYYHFVTHLPVIEKLGLPFLGTGEICLLTAADWLSMQAEDFTVQTIQTPQIPAVVWRQLNITVADLEKLSAAEIYGLLQKYLITA